MKNSSKDPPRSQSRFYKNKEAKFYFFLDKYQG